MLPHILKLAAGVGLFMFAAYLLEESLKNLSGRQFKIFLQRITRNTPGAIAGGAVVTGVLQSSTMVILMVLAFVGAGVFTLENAMAIILGANLGTTLDSWLVATAGFKINIEVAAYPAVCVGGLLLILFGNRKTLKFASYFIFGFGLLFIGLSFMKTALEEQVKVFDFERYSDMPPFIFMLIGFGLTLLVQSSSVTMALALSALHAGALHFPSAVLVVLGSETGTTIKIMLTALHGNATKKRIVTGNFLYNLCMTLLAFIFMKPTLWLITSGFNIHDPLIGLVTFSTLVNLVGIILFAPFLRGFVGFLENRFTHTATSNVAFIDHANIHEPELALELFHKETAFFLHNSMLFNMSLLELETTQLVSNNEFTKINEERHFFSMPVEAKYEFLKQLQGELQTFYLKLRSALHESQNSSLDQYAAAVRNSMYSSKCMKDIISNLNNLRQSSKDIKYDFFLKQKAETGHLYDTLRTLCNEKHEPTHETFRHILSDMQYNYNESLHRFYKELYESPIESLDITVLLNFNRELYASNKAMLMAVKDFLSDEKTVLTISEMSAEDHGNA
ncbi:MAG: Na/Pi cotransporter family protein [Bacteroidetes bacterium]|nr:Na/Pi cotransporter family protein [Bacteroidota bacterium]